MPSKRTSQPSEPAGPTQLTRPRSEIEEQLKQQIQKGVAIRDRQITNDDQLEQARQDYSSWQQFNETLLLHSFSDDSVANRYRVVVVGWLDEHRSPQLRIAELKKRISNRLDNLGSLVEQLSLYKEPASISQTALRRDQSGPNNDRVFIVHGHDDGMLDTVARFIEHLDLKAIILAEQPGMGRTIIEKFEANSDVGYAVVLLTPDDVGRLDGTANEEQKRARQNVLFELGYFVGKLDRGKVCLLRRGELEMPSDLAGIEYVTFDDGGAWRMKVAIELRAAELDVDLNKALSAQRGR